MAGDAKTYQVTVRRNVETRMRDGVILRSDMAYPKARGRFPVLLTRTPYGKGVSATLAAAGYVVIAQDMRGRYASEGEFTPKFLPGYKDAEDGYDTVEWAAGLPVSTGKVGVFGISYPSWAAWELAALRPPHLAAMFTGGYSTRMTDWELGGVLRIGRVLQWMFQTLGPDQRRRKGWGPPHTPDEARARAVKDREKPLWYAPLKDLPDEIAGGIRDIWTAWLDHHHEDVFDFGKRHGQVDVPVMHMTGWYDRLVLTVDHFSGMQQNGHTANTRAAQRMVVGPWSHSANGPRTVGMMDFGQSAEVNYDDLMIRWFDYWLKGQRNGMMRTPPVKYFVMGENRWRSAATWPVPDAKPVAFYLDSKRAANTPRGNGRLIRSAPKKEVSDHYVYDPKDPVMTLFLPNAQDAPYDQRLLDTREDILVYQTPVLKQAVRLVGRPDVILYARSSARDTDFIVKIQDVHPDGFVQQVSYGIVRARFREGFDRPKLLQPGRIYKYTIQMLPTAVLFKPGHRIRLDVSSSDFPNFDRNHNTGGDDYGEDRFLTARQEVFHGGQHASRVICPVIPIAADTRRRKRDKREG